MIDNELIPIHIHIQSNSGLKTIFTKSLLYVDDDELKTGGADPEKEVPVPKSSPSTPSPPSSSTPDSQYPFFTVHTQYTLDSFINLTRQEQIDVFFSKKLLKRHLIRHGVSQTSINDDEAEKRRIRFANAKHNIVVMLNVLFPTHFPLENNIKDTFSQNISENGTYPMKIKVLPDFMRFDKNQDHYAYIQSGGIYTVSEITIINDVLNDPEYSAFLENMYKYVKWLKRNNGPAKIIQSRLKEIKVILDEFYKTVDKNTEKYRKMFDPNINVNIAKQTNKFVKQYTNRTIEFFEQIKAEQDPEEKVNILLSLRAYHISFMNNYRKLPDEFILIDSDIKIEKVYPSAFLYKVLSGLVIKSNNNNNTNNNNNNEFELIDLKKINELLQLFSKKSSEINDPIIQEVNKKKIDYIQTFQEIKQILTQFMLFPYQSLNPELQHIFDLARTDKSIELFSKYVYNLKNNKSVEGFNFNNDPLDIGLLGVLQKRKETEELEEMMEDKLNLTKYLENYKVNVFLEVIQGKIDSRIIRKIKCAYSNKSLVKLYHELTDRAKQHNNYKFEPEDEIISLDELVKISDDNIKPMSGTKGGFILKKKSSSNYKTKSAKVSPAKVNTVKQTKKRGGGSRKTRRLYKKSKTTTSFWPLKIF